MQISDYNDITGNQDGDCHGSSVQFLDCGYILRGWFPPAGSSFKGKKERGYLRQFNLHKKNAANEELVISLICGREVQERKLIYVLRHHYTD